MKKNGLLAAHVEKATRTIGKVTSLLRLNVDSDSDVSDDSDKGIDTDSEGDESTDTAEESKLFCNANLKYELLTLRNSSLFKSLKGLRALRPI